MGWAVAFNVRDAVVFFSSPVPFDREHLLGRLRGFAVGRHLVESFVTPATKKKSPKPVSTSFLFDLATMSEDEF